MKRNCNIATLIERYFTERLMRQRNVSANTIASYRDTFRLLFTFAQTKLRKDPAGGWGSSVERQIGKARLAMGMHSHTSHPPNATRRGVGTRLTSF